MTGHRRVDHPLVAAAYDPVHGLVDRVALGRYRSDLVRGLHGRVLDLGAGTGRLLPYVAETAVDEVSLLEPDPAMLERAASRASAVGVVVRPARGVGERMPYPDDAFDAVVSAMVLCTVDDPNATVSEVARVLETGGEVRFLEHVADVGWRRRVQELVGPAWRRLAGGCHPDRRTDELLQGHPSFETLAFDRRSLGVTPVRPFVSGRLRRR